MARFIRNTDYNASIHAEILDAVTRSDPAVIDICEDRAIEEMRSYLARRYDCSQLLSVGQDNEQAYSTRNQLVLMMAIDIAIYHIFSIHNPMKLSQLRKERYERAVEWLKAVAAGKISIEGATLATEERQIANQPLSIISNKKRQNHF